MTMEIKLSSRLMYKLRLNTQMRFSLYVLQMPLFKLKSVIKQQIEDNPLLEISGAEPGGEETIPADTLLAPSETSGGDKYAEERPVKEPRSLTGFTLREYLLLQLHLLCNSDRDREIGEMIIGNLDDDGYLMYSVKELAGNMGVKEHQVENVLSLVQTFEPSGVAARDLRECLIAQLKVRGELNSLAGRIADSYLPDLEKKKFGYIAKKLGVSVEEVRNSLKEINRLEPKPGRSFHTETTVWLIPEATIAKTKDGYEIVSNNEDLPRITINSKYRKMMTQKDAPEDAKEYLKGRFIAAQRLIAAIERRKETVGSVLNEIISFQKDFLDKGVDKLKPFTIGQIASRIKKHKSTVSRAMNNKYVQTPWGILELKYFLSSGVKRKGGQVVSSRIVKERVADLIEKENKARPLSDQEITSRLNNKGIPVKRRTVAKYRKQLKIMSSQSRKK